jgi:hypothetical protein
MYSYLYFDVYGAQFLKFDGHRHSICILYPLQIEKRVMGVKRSVTNLVGHLVIHDSNLTQFCGQCTHFTSGSTQKEFAKHPRNSRWATSEKCAPSYRIHVLNSLKRRDGKQMVLKNVCMRYARVLYGVLEGIANSCVDFVVLQRCFLHLCIRNIYKNCMYNITIYDKRI